MLGKKVYCFNRFWFLIKVFRSFCGKVSARWSKLLFTSTDDPSEKEEQTSWITHKFLFFSEFERQIHGVWWGTFMHGCQNCILHVRRDNSRKIWFWGKSLLFYHIWISMKNVRSFRRKVSARWSKNCISRQEMIVPKMNKSLE